MTVLQLPALHTGEEMQRISNLAHVVEGAVIGAAAVVMMLESRNRLRGSGAPYAWPLLLFVAGVFLLGYMLIPHHGIELARTQWRWVFADPQQRQHLLLAALIAMGAGGELVARAQATAAPAWRHAWPLTTAIIGIMFLVHTQHGTDAAVARATAIHRALGSVLIAAALLRDVSVWRLGRRAAFELSAGVALLVAAALLVVYREPAGAYLPDSTAAHGAAHRP